VAGLVGTATLLLIRIIIASLFAVAVASLAAVVRGYLYLFSSSSGDGGWLMRVGRSPAWLALKIGAYPFVGDRALDPGFDLGVILLSIGTDAVMSLGWGVLLGVLTVGRAAAAALPVGLLLGMAAWFVKGYVISPLFGGGQLAGGPALLMEFVPYGLAMAIAFMRYERKHGVPTHRPESAPWRLPTEHPLA
jgi:hypothetical protein